MARVAGTGSVVVVGGGAIGLCTALELLELGAATVTVLEKGSVGGGSSGLAVGIIETQYLDALSIAIRVSSMAFFARLERDCGLPITRTGYLRLGHTASDLERYAGSVAIQRSLGVSDADVVDPTAIDRLVPGIDTTGIVGGLWGPSDGYLDPALYCSTVARLVRERGGTILVGTALTGCDDLPDGRHRLSTTGPTHWSGIRWT